MSETRENAPDNDQAAATEQGAQPASVFEAALTLAGTIGHDRFPSGDRAALRRLRPDGTWPAAFWRVLFDRVPEALRGTEEDERRWAVVMQAMAIMAPEGHVNQRNLGRALALAGGEAMEHRLLRLLRSQGSGLEDQIRLTARLLHGYALPVDQVDFARLLFLTDESAVRFRRALARDYFETCRAKQQTASASPAPTA